MYDTSRNILINLEICPNQLCTKPRTKNRSRGSERLKRNQHLALKYRYSERRKGVHVAPAIKLSGASNRTRHFWRPFCLLFCARACEKTWVQAKQSANQTKVSFVVCLRVFGKMSGSDCRRFLPSPHPLPLVLIFRNFSQFSSSSRAFGKGKETAATQATHVVYCTAGSQLDIGIVALVRESCFEINIWELDMNIKKLDV